MCVQKVRQFKGIAFIHLLANSNMKILLHIKIIEINIKLIIANEIKFKVNEEIRRQDCWDFCKCYFSSKG